MESKERRPMDLFSTAVVDSDEAREARWFCYCAGQSVPGETRSVRASREETNLQVANQLVDKRQLLRTCAIRIPAVSPAAFQRTGTPYAVTPDDVAEFCRHAVVRLMIGGEVPWVEFTPKSTRLFAPSTVAEIERGEGLSGSFSEQVWPASDEGMRPVMVRGQEKPFCLERGVVLPQSLLVNRIERFWADLSWLNGPPTFGKHPDDSSVRGRLAVEYWMIGDEALPTDCDEALARVLGK